MLNLAANKTSNVEVGKAIQRMKTHACKSKSSFAKALKVKAPESAYGVLAGPTKANKID